MKRLIYFWLVVLFLAGCNFPTVTEETYSEEESSPQDQPTQAELPTAQPMPEVEDPTPLIYPEDLTYLGAFRLPDDGDRPYTFEYGGNAMTVIVHPDGSRGLIISGHDRLPYGEMPDGSQIAEVSIPTALIADAVTDLPTAEFLQPFSDVAAGHFTTLEELPRIGLAYLDHPTTGPLIHIVWGAHFQEEESDAPSHGWFSTDLSQPDFQGEWYLDDLNLYAVNGYAFTLPADWAQAHTNGYQLASGRYRDGGWSGMGPNVVAYQPWNADGSAPADESRLDAITLLAYETSYAATDYERAMDGYSHADEWEGAAWLSATDGKMALIFSGTKATGAKTWYGWVNPQGAELPCIETELRDQFTTCVNADGTPCPDSDLSGCAGHNDYRGWWSSSFEAQIIFYNPDQLAMVAAGTIAPYQPQPYAVMSVEDVLFHNPDNVEPEMLGTGVQTLHRLGAAAFDEENGLLYVLELFADGAKPVVHVWGVE